MSTQIETALSYWHDRLSKEYGEDKILNITLYGSVNIILKFFNLINWSWSATLWPLWAELIIIAILWLSGNLD